MLEIRNCIYEKSTIIADKECHTRNIMSSNIIKYIFKQVLDRFPTMDSLVESKLLLPHEAERLEKVKVLNESNLKVLFGDRYI